MRFHLFAPSTVIAVLLALTSYAPRIDNSVREAFGVTPSDVSQADSDAPATATAGALAAGETAPSAPQQNPQAAAPVQPPAADESAADTAAADPVIQRHARIERGDSLGEVLQRASIPGAEIPAVLAALTRIVDPYDLKPGQAIDASLQKDGDGLRLVSLDMHPDAERSISLTATPDGFTAREIRARLSTVTRAAIATIDGSLYEAGYKAKLPPQILAAFIRAYSYSVDFQRDIQPGDKFAVLYQLEENDRGEMVRPGNILAAFLRLGDRAQRIYLRQSAEGTLEFYSPDGRSIRRMLLRTPVDGARVTSGFGMRMHPLLGYSKMHKGVDFGAPPGTPVFAAGDGVIEKMGWWGGYGKYMRIRHDSSTGTAYAHLSRFNPNLREGSRVRQGQVIALTGSTGESTGPHLHFEVLKNGVQVNPLTATASVGDMLQGRDLIAFRKLMDERDRVMKELIGSTQVAAQTVNTVEKVE